MKISWNKKSSSLIIALLLASGCSAPSTNICGIKVSEGKQLPIKVDNKELLKVIASLDQSNQARKEGKRVYPPHFSVNESSGDTLVLAGGLALAGIGSDGENLILRDVESWESSGYEVAAFLCSSDNSF